MLCLNSCDDPCEPTGQPDKELCIAASIDKGSPVDNIIYSVNLDSYESFSTSEIILPKQMFGCSLAFIDLSERDRLKVIEGNQLSDWAINPFPEKDMATPLLDSEANAYFSLKDSTLIYITNRAGNLRLLAEDLAPNRPLVFSSSEGLLIYATDGGGLKAQNTSGVEIYRIDVADPIQYSVSSEGEYLALTSNDSLWVYSAGNGVAQWSIAIDSVSKICPAENGSEVYLLSQDRKKLMSATGDGSIREIYSTEGRINSLGVMKNGAIAIALFAENRYVAIELHPDNGAVEGIILSGATEIVVGS